MEGVRQKLNTQGELESILVFDKRKRYYLPDHPNAEKDGKISEHRLLAANALGKALPKKSTVHHHDGILVICQDQEYHHLIHIRIRAFEVTGDPNKRKCFLCKQWDVLSNLSGRKDRVSFYHLRCERARYHQRTAKKNFEKGGEKE